MAQRKLRRGIYLLERDGWYSLRFQTLAKPPEKKRVRLDTRNADVAVSKAMILIKQFDLGQFDPWKDTAGERTICEALSIYLEEQEFRNLRPSSINSIKGRIGLLCRRVGESTPIGTVSAHDLRRFILDPARSKISHYTYFGTVRAFFNFCADRGLIDDNPIKELRPPKLRRGAPQFLLKEEYERIVACIEYDYTAKRHMLRRPREIIWLKDAVTLLVNTGIRPGALRNLRMCDVVLASGTRAWIDVRSHGAEGPKCDSERRVPIPTGAAREVVERLLAGRSSEDEMERLLKAPQGGPIDLKRLSRRFKFYLEMAKCPSELKLYSLRHTYASWLVMAGVPLYTVSKLLGHKSITTTEIYAGLAESVLTDPVEEVFGNGARLGPGIGNT